MRFLVILVSVLSINAFAEYPRYENHLGGVYDREERRYVPGSGTAAPPLGGLPVRPVAPPIADAEAAPAMPAGATETYNVYSRGNDDTLERDEAGVSNFETARIRLSAFTLPRAGGGHTLGIRYVATLTTAEEQAATIGRLGRLVCSDDNLNVSLRPAPMQLVLQRPPGGGARNATLTAQLTIGGATQNGTYQGVCAIVFPGGGGIRQVIRWRATVANGAAPVITTTFVENDAPGGRRGDEILRRIESNENPRPALATAFPPKTGEARGPARFGAR